MVLMDSNTFTRNEFPGTNGLSLLVVNKTGELPKNDVSSTCLYSTLHRTQFKGTKDPSCYGCKIKTDESCDKYRGLN